MNLDGHPVAWGVLTFYPESEYLPPTSVRVRLGKYSAPAELGPVKGKATLTFEGSIWESTGSPNDKVVNLKSKSPHDDAPIEVPLEDGAVRIDLEFRSR